MLPSGSVGERSRCRDGTSAGYPVGTATLKSRWTIVGLLRRNSPATILRRSRKRVSWRTGGWSMRS